MAIKKIIEIDVKTNDAVKNVDKLGDSLDDVTKSQKDVKEAKPYIISLSKRMNFWNKKLRKNAKRVLEKWDVE